MNPTEIIEAEPICLGDFRILVQAIKDEWEKKESTPDRTDYWSKKDVLRVLNFLIKKLDGMPEWADKA